MSSFKVLTGLFARPIIPRYGRTGIGPINHVRNVMSNL